MDQNLRYGGEAFFFIGLAIRIATWVFRTAVDVGVNPVLRPSASLPGSMPPEQHARMMSLINPPDPTPTPELVHHCPKCGALVHMDVVHGGLGACRKCGYLAGHEGAA